MIHSLVAITAKGLRKQVSFRQVVETAKHVAIEGDRTAHNSMRAIVLNR
jgi:hypothetical protein